VFKVLATQKTGNSFTVTANGKAGKTYTLQRKTDLASGAWQDLTTQGPLATDGAISLTDPAAPATNAFYRIQTAAP
jgi:hypothetical protein